MCLTSPCLYLAVIVRSRQGGCKEKKKKTEWYFVIRVTHGETQIVRSHGKSRIQSSRRVVVEVVVQEVVAVEVVVGEEAKEEDQREGREEER